ncbi:hypothetical protein F5B20DRAFT_582403 [Whalleya microplaca]|nr:hypothetical protein F5B20DRAFT_582403 [Whalleya microplaca]
MNQVPPQKHTPNRRPKGGRNRNNTPQQKTYASENDIPKYKPDRSDSPTTPQKSASGGAPTLRASSTNQKQRNKNNKKPRKNGNVSPSHKKRDRDSPSLHSKEAPIPIFAGSTFHASPAPSALPIPSFLGRSYPDSPASKVDSPGFRKADSSPEQELSPPTTESDEAEGSPSSPPSIPRTEESPLEFFFRADRAEKAKTGRASSTTTDDIILGPFSPPDESPKECKTFPRAAISNPMHRPAHFQRSTSSGISTIELDGNPGQPVGPAFSTPYQERMRAARSNQSSAQATPTVPRNQELNSSDALKRYLFTGQFGPALRDQRPQQLPTPPRQEAPRTLSDGVPQKLPQQLPQQHSQPLPQAKLPRGMFPASVLTHNASNRQSSAPPAQLASGGNDHNDRILAMEDGLRRMLKLDPSG